MKRLLFAVGLLSAPAFAANNTIMDVNQLNQILQEKHAGWVAKDNHLNQLDPSIIKGMMGAKRDSAKHVRFHDATPNRSSATLPTTLDWRNNNGSWVTPILDQAYCGSCVAFASIGTLETQYRISTGFQNFNVRLSPQYAFSCGGGSCEMGWEPASSASFFQKTGVPDESCMPYTSGETDQDVACTAACKSPSMMVKIASSTTPTTGSFNINNLKTALQSGPLVTTLNVYADFMTYSSGVYKHVTGEDEGGHAVSIIGYDDNQQALLIRNSWGTDWGMNGFAWVAYTDISGVGDDTWQYKMPSVSGALSVQSPMDYSYFTGTAPVTASSTYANTDSITVTFYNSSGTSVYSTVCPGTSCGTSADVSHLPDGTYSVQAVAMDSTGKTLTQSLKQTFYVSNTQPTMTLSFAGTQGTDLTKPLTGIILMAISETTSNNVPMTSVVFHRADSHGTVVTRQATAVATGMLMDWGTENDPNGTYTIWFEGHMTTNGFDEVIKSQQYTVTTTN